MTATKASNGSIKLETSKKSIDSKAPEGNSTVYVALFDEKDKHLTAVMHLTKAMEEENTTTEYAVDYADNYDDDNLSAACVATLCTG